MAATQRTAFCRFIPAYAGNAAARGRHTRCTSVHPRIRGERARAPVAYMAKYGSSPHTRGTRRPESPLTPGLRFIPAYAGNAPGPRTTSADGSVHPRIRGERGVSPTPHLRNHGSSPHTRGTRPLRVIVACVHRFIPAYAGNANGPRGPSWTDTVHPRIRGERTSNKLLIYRRKSESSDSTKHSGC